MGLHIWNLITLRRKKKNLINPWSKKSGGSSDFHQNGFARENTLLKANRADSWQDRLCNERHSIKFWEEESKIWEMVSVEIINSEFTQRL